MGDGVPLGRSAAWRQVALFVGHGALRGYTQWAIELLETGELIGRAGPWMPDGWPAMEIGWVIDPRHQRRGYATEAGAVAQRMAWTALGADRLISLIRPDNEPSAAVARKLGGVLEAEIDFMGGATSVYAYPRPPA